MSDPFQRRDAALRYALPPYAPDGLNTKEVLARAASYLVFLEGENDVQPWAPETVLEIADTFLGKRP